MPPLPLITPPFQDTVFTLDVGGIAGLFGGDEVIEATSSIHLYKGRRWRGWYNSPGAYTVAKYFGCIADSRFWRGLFTGTLQEPTNAFGLDGRKGPKYIGVLSGTELITGHIGYLFANFVKELEGKDLPGNRTTQSTSVTIVDIKSVKKIDNLYVTSSLLQLVFSYFTVLTSVACTIITLILFNDKFCFAAILIGTLIGGITTLIIGVGDLSLITVFTPAPGSPPGDGLLIGQEIIVLRGTEAHVNAITKGRFHLELVGGPKYHIIGFCATLYFLQFLAQLFLIPQGSLAGQIMFLISFGVAWINNCMLASIDKEVIQTKLLLQSIDADIQKFKIPTRTMATIFACLALRRDEKAAEQCPAYNDYKPVRLLETMIPNDTSVWQAWRRIASHVLQSRQPPEYFESALDDPQLSDLRDDQRTLLTHLLRDAHTAYLKYYETTNDNENHHNEKILSF